MRQDSEAAFEALQGRGVEAGVEFAFVLGTGLGAVADAVQDPIAVSYQDLPGFPTLNVSGHDGQVVVGTQEGVRVAYLSGRAHYYEHGLANCMEAPLETLAMLGVQNVVLTAAVGSLNADVHLANLVLVTDHINLNGRNPLIGSGGEGGILSMIDAYDPRLIRQLKRAALLSGVNAHEGVYMWFSGPSFETPAEIRMARMLGADIVGMSIAPEAILARRLGLRTAAIGLVTNFGAGFLGGAPSHAETRQVAAQGAIGLKRLLRSFLRARESDAR